METISQEELALEILKRAEAIEKLSHSSGNIQTILSEAVKAYFFTLDEIKRRTSERDSSK